MEENVVEQQQEQKVEETPTTNEQLSEAKVDAPTNIGVPPKPTKTTQKDNNSLINPISIVLLVVILGGVLYLVKKQK
jgi:hypothetical protein